MCRYLVPVMAFLSIITFTTTAQGVWTAEQEEELRRLERQYDKIKNEKRNYRWNDDDDYQALKDYYGNPQIADKARAGLRGNFGGMATNPILDNDPNFDYIETNEKLGSGTFKEVFLAYRKDLRGNRSEMVVLNKFKSNPGDQMGVFKYYKIFKEEDGLMEVYEVFPKKYWYVTKFYNGDLNKFDKMKPNLAGLNICASDVVKGLVKLIKEKLYHGDLKPANILFRVNKNSEIFCVLADFDSLTPVSQFTQSFVGSVSTPAFVDPELIHKSTRGEKITANDHFKHDTYSVAISLAMFLPFTGEDFRESKMLLDKIIAMNAKYSTTKSESYYLEWRNLRKMFQDAFKRESQKINKDFPYLKELIIKGIREN